MQPTAAAHAAPSPPVLELHGIHKVYGSGDARVHALRGVSLTVRPGDFVAIMGSSGSGKSTLMNVLGCLDRPSAGRFLFAGTDVATLSRNRRANLRNRHIGFVFQSFNLLARTSALENVEMPLLYHPRPLRARDMRRRAWEALARVSLQDRLHHHPNQLSGGQQQRVAIARALVNQPALLLADEPTGNLDSATSLEIMALFQQLNRDGLTVVLVTHEKDISRCARRLLVMRDGLVEQDEEIPVTVDAAALLAGAGRRESLPRAQDAP